MIPDHEIELAMLECALYGAGAALLVCSIALYVQRKIRERRERDKARRAWEGLDEPGNGSVCVWNREDPINGTRVRIRHPQG